MLTTETRIRLCNQAPCDGRRVVQLRCKGQTAALAGYISLESGGNQYGGREKDEMGAAFGSVNCTYAALSSGAVSP